MLKKFRFIFLTGIYLSCTQVLINNINLNFKYQIIPPNQRFIVLKKENVRLLLGRKKPAIKRSGNKITVLIEILNRILQSIVLF
ncbi:hypothetical protein ATZ36_14185 [Candidatus Endomicrobiellum trichonymphae]|jgi:hypothetical protein|uniref:Uncharacterized protein n=1 Tax=Endomicrobium trichonymphae TaxID=1408204 RepID=A0A1E5IN44_ENDTX|nr:hypothetical protein ATZ36_14185 [Candidatus Endomicrobium trichonymphae]